MPANVPESADDDDDGETFVGEQRVLDFEQRLAQCGLRAVVLAVGVEVSLACARTLQPLAVSVAGSMEAVASPWTAMSEIALARRFVADLNTSEDPPSAAKENSASASASALKPDPGTLYWDTKAEGDRQRELTDGLRALWSKIPVLGLTAKEGIPVRPGGPALACQFEITENAVRTGGKDYEVDALVLATGFDAMTGSVAKIDIRGRDGQTLNQKCRASGT